MPIVDKITKDLVIIQAKRVLEILEGDKDIESYYAYPELRSELFKKMGELRRDTIRLEKELRGRD